MSDAIFPSGAHMRPPYVPPEDPAPSPLDRRLNMHPVVAVVFHDGAATNVNGVSFDLPGWLVVHFEDGVVNAYPEHSVRFVQFSEAEEADDADAHVPEDVEDGPDPEWLEGELTCPSCEAIMTPVKQAHTRAVCGSCGYRDPR